jgi:hypothetical protein
MKTCVKVFRQAAEALDDRKDFRRFAALAEEAERREGHQGQRNHGWREGEHRGAPAAPGEDRHEEAHIQDGQKREEARQQDVRNRHGAVEISRYLIFTARRPAHRLTYT